MSQTRISFISIYLSIHVRGKISVVFSNSGLTECTDVVLTEFRLTNRVNIISVIKSTPLSNAVDKEFCHGV